jgi:hypothetical protein
MKRICIDIPDALDAHLDDCVQEWRKIEPELTKEAYAAKVLRHAFKGIQDEADAENALKGANGAISE